MRIVFSIALLLLAHHLMAGGVKGLVQDHQQQPLAYASISIKGTSKGTTTNAKGAYMLELKPGKYTIICQYIGFERKEVSVTIKEEYQTVDFTLAPQQLTLQEVVIQRGEDPAIAIMRHAIKMRPSYLNPLDSFTCKAYIKTLLKLRKLPNRIMGKKIDEKDKKDMGLDSAGSGVIYLSESITDIAFKKPNKVKLSVIKSRESGSNGFGFSFPTFINFYNNQVTVLANELNPRGFVSPVADAGFHYYKYKFKGNFFEEGRMIHQIQVTPKRTMEPLFSGIINIVDGDWRIHSLDLQLTKRYQLELLDTLNIKQLHVPVSENIWQTKDQIVYFTFKQLGVDAIGNFLNVYQDYDLQPTWSKHFFDKVIMKYDSAAAKRDTGYWQINRPVPLSAEEQMDYRKKDSSFIMQTDSLQSKVTRDTLAKRQGSLNPIKFFLGGVDRTTYRLPQNWRVQVSPFAQNLFYNTVEGVVLQQHLTITAPRSLDKSWQLSFAPSWRYGFSNGHLNAWATLQLNKMEKGQLRSNDDDRLSISLIGGKGISQFNNANPITQTWNSIYTLLFGENYMKIYQRKYLGLNINRKAENGLQWIANLRFEDRSPLENTSFASVENEAKRNFTPNYPTELLSQPFTAHQAVLASLELRFQPGQRYIQYPTRKMSIGSKYPTFSLRYRQGIPDILSSDVAFSNWQFQLWDNSNFKLKGELRYRLGAGGFFNNSRVQVQDYQHFNGNQLFFASPYTNSFQIAPYYANSTTAKFYSFGHVEHHFNGLLTNKIPLFNKLKWNLVAGANAFYVNSTNNYVEIFGGLENIFKLFRVDVVGSYLNGRNGTVGIRLGMGGLLGNAIQIQ